MHFLRKIVREIHRRSLWQVVGIYLAGSWGVLQVVDYMTGFAGLPEWTPSMAFVLLLIGLPITVATAFIQQGVPGLTDDPNEVIDPNELEGLTPDEVHRNPDAHPLANSGMFTWRNAILGGVGATVLLLGSVSAYLVMWTFGIGPVGSLVAQGVLDERDPIILADFENRTSDEALGAIVTDALRVDLLESQVVTLIDGRLVDEVLQRMGRPTDEPVTADVAREVAVREGIKAVVEGEVSSVGSGYLLAARVVVPSDGTTLAAFRETADGEDDLLNAIDRISQSLRQKAGESLRTIRAGEPLEAVTTSSLDALRLFAMANQAEEDGDFARTIGLLEEAVALDSTFAMAWRKLAVQHSNRGGDYNAVFEAASAAFRHRDRLTERERYLAEAYYYRVTQDDEATAQAYRRVLDSHPHDPAALNNLGLYYGRREQWAEAGAYYQRAIDGPGRSRSAYNNLVIALYNVGDKDGAMLVMDQWAERYAFDFGQARHRFQVLWGMGDPEGAEAAALEGLEALPEDIFAQIDLRNGLAGMKKAQGRISEARTLYLEIRGVAEGQGLALQAFRANDAMAWLDIMEGQDTTAVFRRIERRFEEDLTDVPPLNLPYADVALNWLLVRDADRAELWYARGLEVLPEQIRASTAFQEGMLLQQGALQWARADYAGQLETLQDLRRRQENCEDCYQRLFAGAYAGLQQPDSAIVYLEALLADDHFDNVDDRENESADVLPQLARLYEEVGRTDEAQATWTRIADRWADADATLQPQVRQARAEAERLARSGG
jgi:tetratricopeptide (TPR) repeat protein